MTIATVEKVAERFLAQQRCDVLALKGAWGVGKTYAWKRIVETSRERIWPPAYSYVSLFGISSLAALRVAILANSRSKELIGQKLTFDLINRNWLRLGFTRATQVWSRIGRVFGDKVSQGVTVGFDVVAPMLVRDMVVCLDDFERLSADRVSHEELLGFISSLKDEAGCKVVIILNEEKLAGNGADYLKYREKVIDLELRFNPTTAEAISWGLPADLWERQRVEACALALDIKNVRILRKISEVVELLQPILSNLHEQVKNAAIRSAVLLTWCYFDASGGAPSLTYLHKRNPMLGSLRKKEENPTPEELRWNTVVGGYRFEPLGELDLAVEKVIEQGYTEESGFAAEAAKLDSLYRSGDKEQRFNAAWDLFHNSFDNNEETVVTEWREGLREGVRQVTPVNLSGTAAILRELGYDELADELISYYIEQHWNEPEIFDLTRNPLAGHITDQLTREAFSRQAALLMKPIPLREAVENMSKGHGWSAQEEAALSAATVNDLYELFKGELSVRKANAVNLCFNFKSSHAPHIAERAVEALRRIAGESDINRVRVRRYGIDVKPLADDDPDAEQGGADQDSSYP